MATAIIGAAGFGLIKEHEGLRTKAYLDPVGIPTICYGHTGPEVRLGQTKTVAECEAILLDDIAKHKAGLKKCIRVPMNPNQWDSITSFGFNLGVGKACASTLVRKLNQGDFSGAAREYPKWNKARVRGALTPLRGLTNRRADEQALFLKPYDPATYKGVLVNIKNIEGMELKSNVDSR